MRIERATAADIPKLCTLLASLFSQEAEFEPDENAQTRGLTYIIDNPQVGDIIAVREADDIIGMVTLLYTFSTALGKRVAILEDMIVSADARGAGVGSRLLKRALELAGQKQCGRITLLTDDSNKRAHQFYQRHGLERSAMVVFRKLM